MKDLFNRPNFYAGFELIEKPYWKQTVPSTGGHKYRKKRRIKKRFTKRYGYKTIYRRLIACGKVMQIGNQIFAHGPEFRALRLEMEKL